MQKKLVTLSAGLLLCFFSIAQSKYAGTMKKLVGTSFTDDRQIKGLRGWTFVEGSLLTGVDDPEVMTASVFRKGTTYIVLGNYMEDTASHTYIIYDLIEIKNVPKGYEPKTGICRNYGAEDVEVVAVVKLDPNKEFLKPATKAWRFNRDKKRFEAISTKKVDCISEGGD